MKKIVPFVKEFNFKTKIDEIVSISLDHNLKLNDNLVSGEFIINGFYKMINNDNNTEFNYKVPVDITIDSKYDTSNCQISIDEFTYEIINEEVLKIKISVMLDDLDIKEDEIDKIELDLDDENNIDIIEEPEIIEENIHNNENNKEYSIYRVYSFKEEDTLDLILDKFNITKELLSDYNDLDNISVGSKLIIPSVDE